MAKKRVRRRRRRRNPATKSNMRPRKRVRRRRRRKSNQWYGQPRRHAAAARKGHRSRRRRRRSNTWYGEPRRHARAARKGHRRRRNPYHYNPRAYALKKGPIDTIIATFQEAFSLDTLEMVFQGALGFGGTVAGTKVITEVLGFEAIKTGAGKVAATGVVAIIGSGVARMVAGPEFAKRFLFGGLLATGLRLLNEVLPEAAKEYIPTLGDDNEFREAIEQEVLEELGVSDYIEPTGLNAYFTQEEDRALTAGAPTTGIIPAGMGAYLTEREGGQLAEYLEPTGLSEEWGGQTMTEQF